MSDPRNADIRMAYFAMLSHDEQVAAIRRMAAQGMTDGVIAAATSLSVEMVRQVIGPRPPKL